MTFSPLGKKKVAGHIVFLILDLISLGLAVKVNKFNDFFYFADLFPLALSIVTLVLLFIMLVLDLSITRSWTALPLTEIFILGLLSIFWLSFNAFSTSRWRGIPMNCGSIPPEYPAERVWCRETNALKAFVWLTCLICIGITLWTVSYTVTQHKAGHKHVLSTPLSRYRPRINNMSHHRNAYSAGSGLSEFFPQRFDKNDPFQSTFEKSQSEPQPFEKSFR